MSKLNINALDAKGLTTQFKMLNSETKKEAQLARIALMQGLMPTINAGRNGAFVMLTNGKNAIYLRGGKTMCEGSFIVGLAQLGRNVGLKQEDILETYNKESAMALCNLVQQETMNKLSVMSAQEVEEISENLKYRLQKFVGDARFAKVSDEEINAVAQQISMDMEFVNEVVNKKNSEEKVKER